MQQHRSDNNWGVTTSHSKHKIDHFTFFRQTDSSWARWSRLYRNVAGEAAHFRTHNWKKFNTARLTGQTVDGALQTFDEVNGEIIRNLNHIALQNYMLLTYLQTAI